MPLQMALRCTSACTSRTGARKAVLRWAAGERNRPRELRSWKLKHRKQRDVSTVTLEYSDRDADGRIQENIVYLPPHKEQVLQVAKCICFICLITCDYDQKSVFWVYIIASISNWQLPSFTNVEYCKKSAW